MLEVVRRTLAEEGARSNDGKADPQSPYDTAQQRNNLMAEQRREGQNEQYDDRDEPSGRQLAQLL